MPKCDFNKVALQLWRDTSVLSLCCPKKSRVLEQFCDGQARHNF